MTGKLFIVSAPSGAGKTCLVNDVIERIRIYYPIDRVITYTTKSPRMGEKEGVDYYFICKEEFERRIDQGFFAEWSTAYGCYYGSPRSLIDEVERGRVCIVIIDRVGAEKIVQNYRGAVLIWLYTKGLEVLRERLLRRNTEKGVHIETRLECGEREIKKEIINPLYNYHILNDDFEYALTKLEKIIRCELSRDRLL